MGVGAELGAMWSCFGYGVVYELWEKGRDGNPLPQMIMGLGPGSIIVNSRGKRFMHGGYTYNDFSAPFGFFDQRNPGFTNKAPAWNIFGAAILERGVSGSKPGISMTLTGPDGQQAPDLGQLPRPVRELGGKNGLHPRT